MNIIFLVCLSGIDTNYIEICIAITAIIVSIIALYFSVRYNRKTFKLTEKHNILSAKPQLSFFYEFVPDREQFKETIIITNSGVGPALIKSVVYQYESKSYNYLLDLYQENFIETLDYMIPESYLKVTLSNHVIGINEKQMIYNAFYKSSAHQQQLFKFLSKVKIIVTYESIYHEKFSINEFISFGE